MQGNVLDRNQINGSNVAQNRTGMGQSKKNKLWWLWIASVLNHFRTFSTFYDHHINTKPCPYPTKFKTLVEQ